MNSGLYTSLVAAAGYDVYSFEPQLACHHMLAATMALNPPSFARHIHAHLAAASNKNTQLRVSSTVCDVFTVRDSPGFTRRAATTPDQARTGVVPVVRLSEYLPGINATREGRVPADQRGRVAVAKIDTEGSESNILADLAPVLASGLVRHVVVEVVPNLWARRGVSQEDAVASLQAVAALASRTLLLVDQDMVRGVRPRAAAGEEVDGVAGPFHEITDLRAFLIDDRLAKKRGCNIWFSFLGENRAGITGGG